MKNFNLPVFGAGAGLRHSHFEEIITTRPDCDWFEVITENFINYGGWVRECLNEISRHYPLVAHGVGLSIGSTDPLDLEFIKKLRAFAEEIRSPWVSDHLCFTMVDHTNLNELIPLPFTKEAVNNCADRIKLIQDTVGKPFLVENVTRYITVSDREMSEADFISAVLEKSDCGLLLDLTNVFLNSSYHKFDAISFLNSIPLNRVAQIHLAGSRINERGEIIDAHNAPVFPEVWELLKYVLNITGPTSILIEWDNDLPALATLMNEVRICREVLKDTCNAA